MRWLIMMLVACSGSRSAAPVAIAAKKPPPPCPCADASVDAAPSDAGIDAPADAMPVVAHPRIMASQFDRLRGSLSTPAAVRWSSAVDRWVAGEDLWGFDAWNAALAGQLTGKTAYCAKAVSVIDAQVAAAELKIAAGAAPMVAGDSYLGVGQMIGDLALVYDWCAPTDSQRARWIAYGNAAVWNVWNHASATWGPWTGWATDDPSDNYYYSFLRATMLLGLATAGENARSDEWIAKFRAKIDQLAKEFAADLEGGGSREGTGYGVAQRNLFELYALWLWSTGENLADRTTHARASISTMIHSIVPTLDRKAPIGDQSRDSTAMLFDYERAYLLELIALYPAAPESSRAVALLDASSVPRMQNSFMLSYDFVFAPTVNPVPLDLPLVRYVSGIGQILGRTSWNKAATWLNLIAGPYTQSHAHQDQGSLMIYRGGWLAYDAVIASKSGLPQDTSVHSLVRIDSGGAPIPQRVGNAGTVLALHVGPGYVFAAVDTTKVYAQQAITLVRRQVLWLQPDTIVVRDHVVTSAITQQTWQLVVPAEPAITGSTAIVNAGAHVLRVTRMEPTVGAWLAYDFRGRPDFTGAWRLDQVQPGGDREYVTSITVDNTAALPVIGWSDVGATFSVGGKQVTVTAGIDSL